VVWAQAGDAAGLRARRRIGDGHVCREPRHHRAARTWGAAAPGAV